MAYGRPGVYISERLIPAPIPTTVNSTAAGACLAKLPQGPITVTRVTSWSEFAKLFGTYNIAYPATFGIGEFFKSGGNELYVRRVIGANADKAEITVTDGTNAIVTFTAITAGSDGNNFRVKLDQVGTSDYFNLGVYREDGSNAGSIADDILLEQYNNILFNDKNSADYVVTVLLAESQFVSATVNETNASAANPDTGLFALAGGTDGDVITNSDFSTALEDFNLIDRTFVIFAPEVLKDLPSTGHLVQDDLIAWAEAHSGFAVLDTPADLPVGDSSATAGSALHYAAAFAASSNAAVYYPNVYIADPKGRNSASLRKVGPAGSVAGLYLATDADSGPFKAPAGLRTSLGGATSTERRFTSDELDRLNSAAQPLNAIRQIPGAGVVVMGARTLKQDGTANRYVSMRRSLLYIKRELSEITQFSLFENNDDELWSRIRASITAFLNQYYNQGGLAGANDTEAFFVICDASNNTSQTIANGEVHIEVGVALEYPAEFVVINLSQKTAA